MKQLYIDHDLPELLCIIYGFLEPAYSCILQTTIIPPSSAASLACICHYFSKLRRDKLKQEHHHKPDQHHCHIERITRRKQICRNHCKAYPILVALAKQSKIDTLRCWRHDYKRHIAIAPGMSPHYPSAFIHFESTGLAHFAPQHIPNIEFIEQCCGGKGWNWRWRSKLNGYDSSNDTDSDSDSDASADSSNILWYPFAQSD